MTEKIRVLTPSQVSNLDRAVDYWAIECELNDYVKGLANRINLDDLGEWRLLVLVTFCSSNGIGVYKRSRRYPSDMEFESSVSVTIPSDEQAHYGLVTVKEDFYFAVNEKYCHFMEPHFEKYDSLYDYMLESSKLAIYALFTHGFVCNGMRIKFRG